MKKTNVKVKKFNVTAKKSDKSMKKSVTPVDVIAVLYVTKCVTVFSL